jgi:hypothetical protein
MDCTSCPPGDPALPTWGMLDEVYDIAEAESKARHDHLTQCGEEGVETFTEVKEQRDFYQEGYENRGSWA